MGGTLSLAAASLALIACNSGPEVHQRADAEVPVTVAGVERKTVPLVVSAIGHVEPIAAVAVRARVGGELQRVGFTEGDQVRAGDVLFVLDQRPFRAALREAEARLARDQALLADAQSDVERYASLVKKEYVTAEQYDQMVANAESLRATVAADEAAVENARLQLSYCTIAAPVSGRTGDLLVTEGNLVKANDDKALVTINQMSPIYVAFPVPAQRLPGLLARRNETITVRASVPELAGGSLEGTLSFVDNTVDAATSTVLLKATFDNRDELLWPGLFVDVALELAREADRVVVPTAAVQSGQQGEYVFVVRQDRTVELRVVKTVRADEVQTVIEEGLSVGETVVTDGQLRLVPGSRVAVKSAGE